MVALTFCKCDGSLLVDHAGMADSGGWLMMVDAEGCGVAGFIVDAFHQGHAASDHRSCVWRTSQKLVDPAVLMLFSHIC